MSGIENFWVFLLAGITLNLTPGADMLYVINRSTAYGLKNGVAAAFGIAAGSALHLLLAVIGVSAILAASPSAMTALRVLGAIYLMWLGYTLFMSSNIIRLPDTVDDEEPESKLFKDFVQGVFVNLLNPKIALFFVAFLPQFISPLAEHPIVTLVILGCVFNVVGTAFNCLVALLASSIRASMAAQDSIFTWLPRLMGAIIMGFGAWLVLSIFMNVR